MTNCFCSFGCISNNLSFTAFQSQLSLFQCATGVASKPCCFACCAVVRQVHFEMGVFASQFTRPVATTYFLAGDGQWWWLWREEWRQWSQAGDRIYWFFCCLYQLDSLLCALLIQAFGVWLDMASISLVPRFGTGYLEYWRGWNGSRPPMLEEREGEGRAEVCLYKLGMRGPHVSTEAASTTSGSWSGSAPSSWLSFKAVLHTGADGFVWIRPPKFQPWFRTPLAGCQDAAHPGCNGNPLSWEKRFRWKPKCGWLKKGSHCSISLPGVGSGPAPWTG